MKKQLFAAIAMLLLMITVIPMCLSASVSAATIEAPILFEGAQIRTDGVWALRFVFSLPREVYEKIEHPENSDDTGLGFGTVIMPEMYLGTKKLTKETKTSIDGKDYCAKIVPAVNIFEQTDDYIYYTACITYIENEKFGLEYVAVPYVTYLDEDGEEVTVYGERSEDITVYSIASLAMFDQKESDSVKAFLQENIFYETVEESLFVTATEHYSLDGTYAVYPDEALIGTRYDSVGRVVAENYMYAMRALPLGGTSDDYFLSEIKLFVKKSVQGPEYDVILAAYPLLEKKTVTAKDVIIDRSEETSKEFYIDEDRRNEKVMTGLIDMGGIKAYIDNNNAPAEYRRTGKALKFIDLTSGSYDKNDSLFNYSYVADFNGMYNKYDHDALTLEFANTFPTVYSGGLYEADVYDSNGDGYADFVFVKNYEFFRMLNKNNHTLSLVNDTLNFKDIKATVEGVEFADKDYVLAYFNADAKYIKVAEVIEPMEEVLISKKAKSKSQILQFESGYTVELYNVANKIVDYGGYSYYDFDPGKQYRCYFYDNIILYVDGSTRNGFDPYADYAMIMDSDVKTLFQVVDGELKESYFVKALIGDKVRTVQLAETARVFNRYNEAGWVTETLEKVTSQKIKTHAQACAIAAELEGKFSTYTKTPDGTYLFTAVEFIDCKDITGSDLAAIFADVEDENAVYYGLRADGSAREVNIKHYNGDIYEIYGDLMGIQRFALTDYSKIVIKSYDSYEDEYVYKIYDASNFPKFDDTQFVDVKAVFINNTESNVENLAILFAEVDEFHSSATKEYRIVVAKGFWATEDESQNIYDILDIKTGTIAADVTASREWEDFSAGDIVVLDTEGRIKTNIEVGTYYAEDRLFAATFADYDKENKMLTVCEDANTYQLSDDTTILLYFDDAYYYMTDDSVLTIDEAEYEFTNEDLKGCAGLSLFMIAEDDEDNDSIKNVKNIVVVPVYGEW